MYALTHNQKLVSAVGALYLIFGLLLIGTALLGGGDRPIDLVARACAVMLGGITTAAGFMLWHGNPYGGPVAAFVTALQIPLFGTPSLYYLFVAGPYLNLIVSGEGGDIQFGATAVVRLGRAGIYSFGINVVALAMLFWLISYIRAQADSAEDEVVSSL
jgi:hypothetical protein